MLRLDLGFNLIRSGKHVRIEVTHARPVEHGDFVSEPETSDRDQELEQWQRRARMLEEVVL
jgi:hypothetical protein